ncbi:MAG: IS200/IS605 family transposase [Leptolyngbya sp. RL_3_1]|nr:IS200/IS605 family transposase [Leptolyngbya sp. RL_3_1]
MRRNFTQLYVHLVWATWDRLPLITPEIQEPIYNVIAYECEQMGCRLVAIGGIEDHVHVLAGFPPNLAISDLVKQIKGSSSHCTNHQIKPDAFFKWQGSYGAFTVNLQELEGVAAYIKNQAKHHRQNTQRPNWELASPSVASPNK